MFQDQTLVSNSTSEIDLKNILPIHNNSSSDELSNLYNFDPIAWLNDNEITIDDIAELFGPTGRDEMDRYLDDPSSKLGIATLKSDLHNFSREMEVIEKDILETVEDIKKSIDAQEFRTTHDPLSDNKEERFKPFTEFDATHSSSWVNSGGVADFGKNSIPTSWIDQVSHNNPNFKQYLAQGEQELHFSPTFGSTGSSFQNFTDSEIDSCDNLDSQETPCSQNLSDNTLYNNLILSTEASFNDQAEGGKESRKSPDEKTCEPNYEQENETPVERPLRRSQRRRACNLSEENLLYLNTQQNIIQFWAQQKKKGKKRIVQDERRRQKYYENQFYHLSQLYTNYFSKQ